MVAYPVLQSDSMTSSTPVLLPQLGLEVTEGRVNAVFVEVGAQVKKDQPLVELETDKAVTDVVAPEDGVVQSIEVAPDDTVPVGAVLVVLATAGARGAGPGRSRSERSPSKRQPAAAPAAHQRRHAPADAPRRRVAPVARRAAAKLGVDLDAVTGTGPRGRGHALRRRGRRREQRAAAPARPPTAARSSPRRGGRSRGA